LTLPITDFLYSILADRYKVKQSIYVFPGSGKTGYLIEPKRQIQKVCHTSGVSFTLHDLRRTYITVAESLDISAYALKRLVNHKMHNDVTAGYIVSDVERLREPMQKININGIELAYERRGKGTPLVLLHGYPLDHHTWDSVAPMLENTFDLIVPDLRGFGDSTTTDEAYTMDTFASDIAGLLDNLGIQQAAIAGHSMGGYIALAFLKNYPQRVRGLGLVSTQTPADPPDRKEGRYKTAADVAEKGIGGVVETMAFKFTADENLQNASRDIMQKQTPAAYIGALKAMAERADTSSLLTGVKFPVTIVHGNADALISVDRAREAKQIVPHAHYVELKGVGHLPMMEAVNETAEALKHLA
jgi:pimeloyl-ACP methyl ester carboxylesterase